MKKTFIFITLFLFSFLVFSKEYSVSCGFVTYGEFHYDATDSFFSVAHFFSYERLLKTFNNSSSLGGEVTFLVDPKKNNYSLSVNFKSYTKEFEGLYFGFSPFSEINFANLFSQNHYLNWGTGIMAGFKMIFSERVDLDAKVTLVSSVYDKSMDFKILASFLFGFLF